MASTFISDAMRVAKSKGAIIAFSLATGAITARQLGPAGSGAYASLLVIPTLLMSFGSLGVRQSSTFLLGTGQVEEAALRRAIITIWIATSILGVVGSYLAISFLSSSSHRQAETLLSVAAIPFSLYSTYLSGIYLGKNNIKEFNRIEWIPPLVVLVANSVLLIWLKMGLLGALIAYVLGPITIFTIVVLRNPIPVGVTKLEFGIIGRLLRLGAIYAISLLVINLNYRIDIILLDRLSTQEELGIYSKGASVTQYLWQIPMLLSTVVFARSATAADAYLYSKKVARLLRVSILFVGAGSIILWLLADSVVRLMYGIPFLASADAIRILLPGVLVMTLFKVMNMDLAGKGKPAISLIAMLPALAVNVVANFLLIPEMGSDGAAWASTISYSVAGVTFLILYSHAVRIPVREILRYKAEDFAFIIAKFRAE